MGEALFFQGKEEVSVQIEEKVAPTERGKS
jgi:hypothetical protein